MTEVVLAGDLRVPAVVEVPGDDHARRVDDKRDERSLRAAGRAYRVFLDLRHDETAVRRYRSGEAEHEGAILLTLPGRLRLRALAAVFDLAYALGAKDGGDHAIGRPVTDAGSKEEDHKREEEAHERLLREAVERGYHS